MSRYITSSLGRASLSASRRHFGNRPTPQPPVGERYIDKVLEELRGRGLSDTSDMRNQNAFKLFQLEQKFLLDQPKLKREMRRLQTMLHPDKFVTKDRDSQNKSEQLSALINEAYSTLKNPYKRAKYLLTLMTGKSPEDIERNLDELKLDPSFLNRMMELREMAATGGNVTEMTRSVSELDSELTTLMTEVNRDFANKDYTALTRKLGKLKFLANCHEALESQISKWGNF